MADQEQIRRWISEFEAIGEQTVRDNVNFRGVSMGGQEKLSAALTWLRDQERKRDAQATAAFNHIRWTFWAAVVSALLAAGTIVAAGIIVVAVLHR